MVDGKWLHSKGEGYQTAARRIMIPNFTKKQTGMVYTPPQYSDHIAVSLLLTFPTSASIEQNNGKSIKFDKVTRKCQAHKQQMRLSSFFTKNPAKKRKIEEKKEKESTSTSNNHKNDAGSHDNKTKKRKKGILAFFGKK
mmetsp:Transcript_11100/g.20378  ORF Transcript_11100/g.20378 Transcript_11100/m.20378 type:complete len:139 (+) Transcript_11100:23-439(+)